MKKTKDYWPPSDDEQRAWLVHFKAQLPTYGPAVGVTPAEIAGFNSVCDSATGSIDNAVTKKSAYDSALANREEQVQQAVSVFRPLVRRIKAATTYTDTIGEALDIEGETTPIDPNLIKPALAAVPHSGYVRLRVKRNGAQSVNLYLRRAGQPGWTLVCRLERATCQDTTPLALPTVPEVREYQVIGVVDDQEVGLPSNPVTVVYAGALAA